MTRGERNPTPESRGFRLGFSVTNTAVQTPVVLVTTPSCALLVARLAQQAVVTTPSVARLATRLSPTAVVTTPSVARLVAKQSKTAVVTTPCETRLVARLAQQAVVTTVAIQSLSKASGLTTDYVT